MNAFPSAFAPCSAKKTARGWTLRESHVTWRISSSSANGGTLASVPCNKSRSFMIRLATGVGDESARPSPACLVLELLVSSSWLNPVLILIPVSCAWLRFLLVGCPELHGDFRAASHSCARRRRLIHCKVAANQHRIEPKPQGSARYLAHRLTAEIGHFDFATLIHGNRQRRRPQR